MPKEFILKEIEGNLKFINYCLGSDRVQIHTDSGDRNRLDLPRSFYTFFTLSRLWKNGLGNFDKKKIEQVLENSLSNFEKVVDLEQVFVCLYGMRTCKNFGNQERLNFFLEKFKVQDMQHVYHSGTSMYVFMSTYNEVPELRGDIFMESVYNNCLKAFEVMLGKENSKYQPFYFSEFSSFPDKVPKHLLTDAEKYIKTNFNAEYLKQNLHSSGVAKTLEHFASVGDMEGFNLGLEFLEKRKYKHLTGFKNTFLPDFDRIYAELSDSMYVILDTNTHLINAYLNFYEKSN